MSSCHLKRRAAESKTQLPSATSSLLARAFDQCPSVLFSLLEDREASQVARALCYPNLLANKRYIVKHEVAWVKTIDVDKRNLSWGDIPSLCVKPKLYVKDTLSEVLNHLAQIPPTVRSLRICLSCLPQSSWGPYAPLDIKNLPRSITQVTFSATQVPVLIVAASESDWPPLLSSFIWDGFNGLSMPLPLLPSSLRMMTLAGHFKELRLPSGLLELDLTLSAFLSPLSHSTLQKVIFSPSFNQPILARNLPNLRVLRLGDGFTHPLDDLPFSLTELALDGLISYDHPLDRLPATLKRLELRRPYHHSLDRLPSSLSYLFLFSTRSDQSLDHLPQSLTELDLMSLDSYNRPLNRLPDKLQMLKLGKAFNQPFDSPPPNLTYLQFHPSSEFDQALDLLPPSLSRLELPNRYNRPLDQLPSSLQTLIMPQEYNQPLNDLPSSLTALKFPLNAAFDQSLDHFPNSISTLILGNAFDQPIKRLPCGLTHLRLGDTFDQDLPLEPHLVPSLRVLHLGRSFNQHLEWPPSLTELVFHQEGCFDQPLSDSLRDKLVTLVLPESYERIEW